MELLQVCSEVGKITPVTATIGSCSRALEPGSAGPTCRAGLMTNVQFSEAVRQSALVQYERAIQTGFAEVSKAMIAHQRVRESREQHELLAPALQGGARPFADPVE